MKTIARNTAASYLMAVFFLSCSNTTTTEQTDSTDTAEEKNEQAFDSKAAEKDAQFVVDAVAHNYTDVKLAQLAQKKSSSQLIKSIAKNLEADHLSVLKELKNFAQVRRITIPVEETSTDKDEIKALSTSEKIIGFDKEWVETVMDKHRNSISRFERAATEVTDPALNKWIALTLPKLRTHHEQLMECHKSIN